MQYKLLVRAINESTNEELAQLVSQSFSVRYLSCLHQHMVIAAISSMTSYMRGLSLGHTSL